MAIDPQIIPFLPLILFASVISFLIYRVARFGFKGALIGARLGTLIGEFELSGGALLRKRLRVYLTESDNPDKAIALEFAYAYWASRNFSMVAMSAANAEQLTGLLKTAIASSRRR